MIAKLRKLLAEAHTSGDIVKTLLQADYDYLITRAKEEIEEAQKELKEEEANRRLILATRLITLARYKLANPVTNEEQKLPCKRRGRNTPVLPG